MRRFSGVGSAVVLPPVWVAVRWMRSTRVPNQSVGRRVEDFPLQVDHRDAPLLRQPAEGLVELLRPLELGLERRDGVEDRDGPGAEDQRRAPSPCSPGRRRPSPRPPRRRCRTRSSPPAACTRRAVWPAAAGPSLPPPTSMAEVSPPSAVCVRWSPTSSLHSHQPSVLSFAPRCIHFSTASSAGVFPAPRRGQSP